ncbi:MAG: right-handed parallel beta-helix repeat-containing protein [Acidimicrobiales bacterium]|nr:right-handed parallel beta-helix repeat-containing protein [Acidimicrobiales bacterium]
MLVPTAIRSHRTEPSGNGSSRRATRVRRLVMGSVAAVGSIGGTALLAQPASAAPTLTISPTGTDTGNCQVTPCLTLAYALTQDAPGDTISVAAGTYDVASTTTVPATLSGSVGSPTIIQSASGAGATAFVSTGATYGLVVNASNVTVEGLTFDSFGAAGIMVSPPQSASPPATVSGDTVMNNVINNADQCENTPSTPACTAAIGAGDYGESMWIMSATGSTIQGNNLEGGLGGGMLISDELGPNHGNTIESNIVEDNFLGCGITLAGHNMAAVFTSGPNAGQPNPAAGGVYSNTVEGNTSSDNGATGIGLFNFAYNNTISGNTAAGNGEPGIEVDSTFPGADLNGNSITGNTVGANSLMDGPGGNSPGQHTIHATQTSGIMVIAKATPVTGTVIASNTISGNYYGIWMSALGASTTLTANVITGAKVAVFISPAPGSGYWELGSDGGVFSFGASPYEGSTGGLKLAQPVVGMAATPDGGGYWLVARDGGLFNFGDANYYGSLPGLHVSVSDIVGVASTPDGGGYWMVAKDGGVFGFGDAKYYGSLPGMKVSVSNVVGIAATPDGGGYWMVAKDGGIFSFGDATYFGSLPGMKVKVSNIVGIAPTSDGNGYWLVGSDGGLFGFGDAKYFGSLPGLKVKVSNVVAMAATPDGNGYWLVGSDGGLFSFGDATYYGSLPGLHIKVSNIVGMVPA